MWQLGQRSNWIAWKTWVTILASILLTSCSKPKSIASSPIALEKQIGVVGVRKPETLTVEEVALEDNENVIGVSVGHNYRAYLVKALKSGLDADPESDAALPIVNDLLGGVPITVTYCEKTERCRVLTSSGTESLDLGVYGWIDSPLEVILDGKRYPQWDPLLPFNDYMFQLTSWGSWKAEHPNTDVYIGPLYDD